MAISLRFYALWCALSNLVLMIAGLWKSPSPYRFVSLPKFPESSILLIFPGFGGPDEHTNRIVQEVEESDRRYGLRRKVFCYDWSEHRGNIFTAAFTSQELGLFIGKQIADKVLNNTANEDEGASVPNLHVIGISVGAFAADSCVKEFKNRVTAIVGPDGATTTRTRLTFLDPFTSRGLFGFRYGPKYFGRHADYCEHYLNSDDPVPFTNTPLPHACTFDITAAHERGSFTPRKGDSMHSWPVAFFGRHWRNSIDPRAHSTTYAENHVLNPRGSVVYVK